MSNARTGRGVPAPLRRTRAGILVPRPVASITRRRFLGRGALGLGALAVGPGLLAACGGDDDDDDTAATAGTGGGGGGGALDISNWPAYIDDETVPLFEAATGISVTYTEDINDNDEFFAQVLPDLQQGRSIGRDIVVLTDWMAARWAQLGFAQELNKSLIPNAANIVPSLAHPGFDPDRTFTLPWRSGIGGIAYDPELTQREITSVEDLFDPAFEGQVGFLTEMRDSVGLVMLAEGADVENPTFEAAQAAFDRIEEAVASGQIRAFYGNEFVNDLAQGNLALCVGWSGDVFSILPDNPNLVFVVPDEGGTLWSDNMLIPTGAEHVDAAHAWMDFVYDPVNSARITVGSSYISPVVDQTQLEEVDPALAADPLVNPPAELRDRLVIFGALSEEEETRFDERWQEILQG
jgi:spermidine/putrescine transport system substrate-binding protein